MVRKRNLPPTIANGSAAKKKVSDGSAIGGSRSGGNQQSWVVSSSDKGRRSKSSDNTDTDDGSANQNKTSHGGFSGWQVKSKGKAKKKSNEMSDSEDDDFESRPVEPPKLSGGHSKAAKAAARPTTVIVEGVSIRFPFSPYPSQVDMMMKIVEALNKEQNALLESPTGSGKSLALLCGALAWLESEKEKRRQEFLRAEEKARLEREKVIVIESPYFEDMKSNHLGLFDENTERSAFKASKAVISKSPINIGYEDQPLNSSSTSTSVSNTSSTGGCGSCSSSVKFRKDNGGSCGSRSILIDDEVEDDEDDYFQSTSITEAKVKAEWRQKYSHDSETKGVSSSASAAQLHSRSSSRVPPIPTSNPDYVEPYARNLPKIYFGSRTHKQITQLVKELQSNSAYRPKMAVLGGRNHYCVNDKFKNKPNKNDLCLQLLDTSDCYLRHRSDDLATAFTRAPNKGAGVWDMEDLIDAGKHFGGCSYYTARKLASHAELIFCPYQYLVNPQIRKAMEIDLHGAIVILDEAHNIEDVARDAGSLDLSQVVVNEAIGQFEDMIKNFVMPDSCAKLVYICKRFSTIMSEMEFNMNRSDQKYELNSELWDVSKLMPLLQQWNITSETIHEYSKAVSKIAKAIKEQKEKEKEKEKEKKKKESGQRPSDARSNSNEKSDWPPAGYRVDSNGELVNIPLVVVSLTALRALEELILILVRFFNPDLDCCGDYKIAIVETLVRKKGRKTVVEAGESDSEIAPSKSTQQRLSFGNGFQRRADWPTNSNVEKVREMKFWCLNPGVVFRGLSAMTRSVILTSGTLSPTDSFASELQTAFDVRLEASHVIDRSQVWVGSVPVGPSNIRLEGTHAVRHTFGYQDEVGLAVEGIINRVPHGALLFLPSYFLMDALMERWSRTGQLSRLEARKKVMVEPRNSTTKEFDIFLRKYYTHISKAVEDGHDGGVLLLAVYRGKCSEGIDFTDANCRVVMALSIPFPALTDTKIKLKKEYNDKNMHSTYQPLSKEMMRAGLDGQPAPSLSAFAASSTRFNVEDLMNMDIPNPGLAHVERILATVATVKDSVRPPRVRRNLLTGNRWYDIQAYRAYNQAIGRCIRHRKDWGAMILLDHRMTLPNTWKNLSKWVQPLLAKGMAFDETMKSLEHWLAWVQTNEVGGGIPRPQGELTVGDDGDVLVIKSEEVAARPTVNAEGTATTIPTAVTISSASMSKVKEEPDIKKESTAEASEPQQLPPGTSSPQANIKSVIAIDDFEGMDIDMEESFWDDNDSNSVGGEHTGQAATAVEGSSPADSSANTDDTPLSLKLSQLSQLSWSSASTSTGTTVHVAPIPSSFSISGSSSGLEDISMQATGSASISTSTAASVQPQFLTRHRSFSRTTSAISIDTSMTTTSPQRERSATLSPAVFHDAASWSGDEGGSEAVWTDIDGIGIVEDSDDEDTTRDKLSVSASVSTSSANKIDNNMDNHSTDQATTLLSWTISCRVCDLCFLRCDRQPKTKNMVVNTMINELLLSTGREQAKIPKYEHLYVVEKGGVSTEKEQLGAQSIASLFPSTSGPKKTAVPCVYHAGDNAFYEVVRCLACHGKAEGSATTSKAAAVPVPILGVRIVGRPDTSQKPMDIGDYWLNCDAISVRTDKSR